VMKNVRCRQDQGVMGDDIRTLPLSSTNLMNLWHVDGIKFEGYISLVPLSNLQKIPWADEGTWRMSWSEGDVRESCY
jgi:hypothetical protein